MNKIWSGMIIISIILSILGGKLQVLITTLMDSTQNALKIALEMFGMMCMWSGFMKIAEASGIISRIT